MTVRKTAFTIYTDKVILPRRGKVRKEETNRKKKKQQIVLDGRNIYDKKEMEELGFVYHCIGK